MVVPHLLRVEGRVALLATDGAADAADRLGAGALAAAAAASRLLLNLHTGGKSTE